MVSIETRTNQDVSKNMIYFGCHTNDFLPRRKIEKLRHSTLRSSEPPLKKYCVPLFSEIKTDAKIKQKKIITRQSIKS